MIILKELLEEVFYKALIGNPAVVIQAITHDSRTVTPGSLFVAISGYVADGHAFIPQAIAKGSKVVVCEHPPASIEQDITYVLVENSRLAISALAAAFYGHPSRQLKLVAVTGTNGKTTTVHLLYYLFEALGYRTGMFSTIQNKVHDHAIPSTHTTSDPIVFQQLLRKMVDEGCQYCFMEASSHGIEQNRLASTTLTGAVFTNITHDHLDHHHTFDQYIAAKKKLFDNLTASSFALYNADDRRGPIMMQNTQARVYTFALQQYADFTARIMANTLEGLSLRIDNKEVWFQLIGAFNAYNLLAAYGVACLLGQLPETALQGLSSIKPITGRLQLITNEQGVYGAVDYAHTPDALEKVLDTLRTTLSPGGRIITVVGCGGDRDKAKRPIMGQIACKRSEQTIFTTDNPRSEVPEAIIEDMRKGLTLEQQRRTLVILDRAEAIKTACALAHKGDIVLVAGKGHETYQEIRTQRYPFDDAVVLAQALGV